MNETFRPIRNRELQRLHRAIDTVVDGLILEKQQPDLDYLKACKFTRESLQIVDFLIDDFFSIFEEKNGRGRQDIFASGLRKVWQKFPSSYFFRFVLPMFKLDEDLGEKTRSLAAEWLELTHFSQKALAEIDKYLKNYSKGQKILEAYRSENKELLRLYASLKTWEEKEKFEKFFADFESLLERGVEVFVFGPIQLYLMLNRETFLLIFKMFSSEKLSEIESESEKAYQEVMAWHDFCHRFLERFLPLHLLREASRRIVKEYIRLLKEGEEGLRQQLPTKELKKRFVERFEKGLLFTQEEE